MSKILSASERQKRRPIILEGISQDLKHTEIATQLGVNRWVVANDLRLMRNHRDRELKRARRGQEEIRSKKQSVNARARNEEFLLMTGMTLREKSFRNMIDFYKPELMRILKSKDQNAAIMRLPRSVRKPLGRNGIITKGWHKREITSQALEYLSNA